MTAPSSHDEYIATAPEQFRALLASLRGRIATTLPEAEEIVAYGMPGFRLSDGTVVGYAAFSKRCGLYLPSEAIAACAGEIDAAGLTSTKTGVTFTLQRPLPETLLDSLLAAAKGR